MKDTVVKADGLWKRYDIHPVHTILGKGRLLARRLSRRGGDEKPFWALRDVSFEVKRGEALGVIGPNGAGKSTLLRILCGVTGATRGRAVVIGRSAPLIELGAGFHPELSGRENVIINGVILGMGLREVRQKYDAIVEFAGLKDFMDMPIKKYSSGMFTRLGFSVAIHSNPEVLLVDEVLAVGDLDFHERCFDAFRAILSSPSSAVVIVSHNLTLVQEICSRALWLQEGAVAHAGTPSDVVDKYRTRALRGSHSVQESTGGNVAYFTAVQIEDDHGNTCHRFATHDTVIIRASFAAVHPVKRPIVGGELRRPDGLLAVSWSTRDDPEAIPVLHGCGEIVFRIDRCRLGPGVFSLTLGIFEPGAFQALHYWPRAAEITVSSPGAVDAAVYREDVQISVVQAGQGGEPTQ